MRNPIEFRKPDPVVSTSEVRAAVVAVGLPKGWTYADDMAMLNKAFAAFSLTDTEARRFAVLRRALTSDGYLNLTLQMALFDAVRALAEQPAPPPHLCPTTSPDDFCRTCKGSGKLREPGERGVTVVSDCWACDGKGTGR